MKGYIPTQADIDELARRLVKDLHGKLEEAVRLAATDGKGMTRDEWWSAM
jgi:hypothetical protein